MQKLKKNCYILTRMTKTENTDHNNASKDMQNRNSHQLLECKMAQSFWKAVWQLFGVKHAPTIWHSPSAHWEWLRRGGSIFIQRHARRCLQWAYFSIPTPKRSQMSIKVNAYRHDGIVHPESKRSRLLVMQKYEEIPK